MIIDLPKAQWERLRDNIADVSCWFMGFSAAKNNDYRGPPGLMDLENLAKDLNNKILDDRS